MTTTDQVKQAIVAVRNGQADKEQERIAKAAGQQAGSRGNEARAAFQGK